MHWTRILIVIIGSIWFFPVSCAVSLIAGTNIIAMIEARDVKKGEAVHPLFSLVVESGDNEEPVRVANLSSLPDFQKPAAVSRQSDI